MTREEAIKILKSKMDGSVDTSYEWAETVRMAIEALRQTEWIPVSKRLPEKNGCYLVSTTGENNYIIDMAFYIEGMWHKASRIKAWMLLPEPYREGREEYKLATEQMEHDTMYEPTYNSEDGSM